MSDYRRWYVPGGFYFFTLVTFNRRHILTTDPGRRFLRQSIQTVRRMQRFDLFATVLLPDHWHLVMQLPRGDANFSARIRRVKSEFSKQWLAAGLAEAPTNPAKAARHERGIWQPRFWEHAIRDEDDLERCVDYIHWNPQKHRLVTRVANWPWSSFHRFVERGQYDADWGEEMPMGIDSQDRGE